MELFEDSRKTLWIGTFQGGLNRYDPASDSFERFTAGTDVRSLRSDQVRDLAENGKGELLVATDQGLDILDAARERVRRISATDGLYVDRLFVDGEGTVWMGCDTGLVRLNPDESISVFFPPLDGPRQVISLTSGEGREILVVFETDALFLFDPATERFRPYPRRHPELATANYLTVERTSRGTLWIGTFDKGLFRDDGPGTPILHSEKPEYREPSRGTRCAGSTRTKTATCGGHLLQRRVGLRSGAAEIPRGRSDPQNSSSLLDNMVRGSGSTRRRASSGSPRFGA
jgi:ligand-binding sensor domain-containing protein